MDSKKQGIEDHQKEAKLVALLSGIALVPVVCFIVHYFSLLCCIELQVAIFTPAAILAFSYVLVFEGARRGNRFLFLPWLIFNLPLLVTSFLMGLVLLFGLDFLLVNTLFGLVLFAWGDFNVLSFHIVYEQFIYLSNQHYTKKQQERSERFRFAA